MISRVKFLKFKIIDKQFLKFKLYKIKNNYKK